MAIKILEKEKIVDIADTKRIEREISILKQISHPYLVRLYEIVETSNAFLIITEYVPGGHLQTKTTKTFPPFSHGKGKRE